jgi:hypothetical protein
MARKAGSFTRSLPAGMQHKIGSSEQYLLAVQTREAVDRLIHALSRELSLEAEGEADVDL